MPIYATLLDSAHGFSGWYQSVLRRRLTVRHGPRNGIANSVSHSYSEVLLYSTVTHKKRVWIKNRLIDNRCFRFGVQLINQLLETWIFVRCARTRDLSCRIITLLLIPDVHRRQLMKPPLTAQQKRRDAPSCYCALRRRSGGRSEEEEAEGSQV